MALFDCKRDLVSIYRTYIHTFSLFWVSGVVQVVHCGYDGNADVALQLDMRKRFRGTNAGMMAQKIKKESSESGKASTSKPPTGEAS